MPLDLVKSAAFDSGAVSDPVAVMLGLDSGHGHRLDTNAHKIKVLLLLVSLYHTLPPRSDVVVGGSGAEGAQALLSPLELTEQPPAFPLKPPAGGSLIPMVPCLAH